MMSSYCMTMYVKFQSGQNQSVRIKQSSDSLSGKDMTGRRHKGIFWSAENVLYLKFLFYFY